MKRLLFILSFLFACISPCLAQRVCPIKDCSITKNFGFSSTTYFLWGTVRIVTDPKEHADFDVKIAPSTEAADLYVKVVKSGPFSCGEWQFVSAKNATPFTFTIRFVSEWEDFTIKFDNDLPGTSY